MNSNSSGTGTLRTDAGRRAAGVLAVLALAFAFAALALPSLAGAATFEVQTTADSTDPLATCAPGLSAECSLRDAIELANAAAPAPSAITFGVAGTITLGSEELPEILGPTEIDAETAPGYSVNETPVVLIDGSATTGPGEQSGLRIGPEAGESVVEGLAIGGFNRGILVESSTGDGGHGSLICANYLGVETDGETALPNRLAGIATAPSSESTEIGAGCGVGNLISGNSRYGLVEGGLKTRISENRIGIDASGNPLPNGNASETSAGIFVEPSAAETFIGGVEDGDAANVIANNVMHGVYVSDGTGSNVQIHANSIYENGGSGIEFGADPPPAEVEIESLFVGDGMVEINWAVEGAPEEVFLVDFYANAACDPEGRGEGEEFIGEAEVETDSAGAITGSSTFFYDLQEGEAITATATDEASRTTSQFSKCGYYDHTAPTVQLNFTPGSTSYETDAFFGFTAEDTGGSGVAVVECELDESGFQGCETENTQFYAGLEETTHEFQVRARDKAGNVGLAETYSWTIEPEPEPATYQVNSLIDTENFNAAEACTTPDHAAGNCSLRDAIALANNDGVRSTIGFAEAAGVIALDEAQLPSITAPVTIDATNAPGYDESPVVEIDGEGVDPGPPSEGISLFPGAQDSNIEGLAIGGFDIGVRMTGETEEGGSRLCGDWIGVGLDGQAFANGVGVESEVVQGDEIGYACGGRANVISGNSSYGIIDYTEGTQISGNFIGTDAAGDELPNGPALPGSAAGVLISSTASKPFIGPDGEGGDGGNTIAYNHGPGILVESSSSNASIRSNSIYANTGKGIEIVNGGATVPRPELESATILPEETAVVGKLEGSAEETYFIDYFVGQECDESGAGEGQAFFAEQEVTTGPDGSASVDLTGRETPPGSGSIVTATATDLETGTTSEFSNCVTREEPQPPPTPEPPVLTETEPASPANDNSPKIFGTAESQLAIALYHEAGCHGTREFFTEAELEAGIGVTVADDSTTEFSAEAFYGETGSGCSEPLTYVEDSTPPTVTLESHPADPTNQTSAAFTFSGDDPGGSGVVGYSCSLDESEPAPCSSPATYSELAAGAHAFSVVAEDAAGNISEPAEFEWTISAAVPVVEIESVAPAAIGAGGSSVLSFSSNKDGAYELLVGGTDCATGTTIASGGYESAPDPISVEVDAADLAEGPNTLRLCLTAAESTGQATAQLRLDTKKPTVEITNHPADPTNQTSASFSFTGSDPGGSGVVGYSCSLDGAAPTSCTSPATYANLGTGPHSFSVLAEDGVGNRSTAAVSNWTISAEPAKPTVVPVNGESFAVAPVSGKIRIRLPGESTFRELTSLEEIPNGALIDATHGKVTLISIDPDGHEQSAVFFGGLFRVTQRKGESLTILRLAGGNARICNGVTRGHALPAKNGVSPCGCPQSSASSEARASASSSLATISGRGGGHGRHLWGSGHGNFRTEGNYGSATVRGTIWFVEDNCLGTFFKVKQGVVSVRDFTRGKSLSLTVGMTYLAKP